MMTDSRPLGLILAVAICLLLGSGLLSGPLGLGTGQGVALGILGAALVLWLTEAVPLFVTGLAVSLLGATWLAPILSVPPETFVAPFASDVILLFLGGFVLSAVLERHGLAERLARWVLKRVGSGSDRVVLGVLLTTAGLSMWMSNTAAAAMMLGLITALLPAIPDKDPLRIGVVLAVAAGANLGGLGTPVGSPPNAVALASLDPSVAPTFLGWMIRSLPVLGITLYGAWRLLLHWFPPTVAELRMDGEPEPFTDSSRYAAGLGLLTVSLWMTVGLHPLSLGMVGLVPVVVAFGSGLLPQQAIRGLPWDVLLLVGGGLCLGAVVSQSGLDGWLLSLLPLEGAGAIFTVVVLALLANALSVVMSNTAAANLVIPLALAIPGLPPVLTALAVSFSCSVGMILPASTPPNAMVFATDSMDSRTFIRAGAAVTGMGLGSILLVGLPWWAFLDWLLG